MANPAIPGLDRTWEDQPKKLDAVYGSPKAGSRVVAYTADGGYNHHWYVISKAPGVRQWFAQHLQTGAIAVLRAPSNSATAKHFKMETRTTVVKILERADLVDALRDDYRKAWKDKAY